MDPSSARTRECSRGSLTPADELWRPRRPQRGAWLGESRGFIQPPSIPRRASPDATVTRAKVSVSIPLTPGARLSGRAEGPPISGRPPKIGQQPR